MKRTAKRKNTTTSSSSIILQHTFMSVYLLIGIIIIITLPSNTNAKKDIDWTSLQNKLLNSTLFGPVQRSEYVHCSTITDPFLKANSQNGICMQREKCTFKFCDSKRYGYNLPLYTLDARSEEDIISALHFATENDLEVSVKTTGSSFQGSSTKRGSLMIRMTNFPKDGEIKSNFTDGCGNVHDVVGIGGGERWRDVIEAVKDEYSIVSPNEQSLSAAGGWLQGGGIAFNSRLYGLGVDNVVDFRVILTDGSIVVANACTNPDLFWSLRGGGGGTFGIVTHIHYKLHPPTEIIEFNFKIFGRDAIVANSDRVRFQVAINQWLNFLITKSALMEMRWCGGHFGHNYAHLLYCGSMGEAKLSFLNDFLMFYRDPSEFISKGEKWGSLYATTIYSNWYEYITSFDDDDDDDEDTTSTSNSTSTSTSTSRVDKSASSSTSQLRIKYTFEGDRNPEDGREKISVRLMPINRVLTDADGVLQMFRNQRIMNSSFGRCNIFLGGKINEVFGTETAVHPAMRRSIFNINTKGDAASNVVRRFIPNDTTGVDYNHHYVIEPDWRNACWGSNYDRLIELKRQYDNRKLLNCWHCVGYIGMEIPERVTPYPTSVPTPVTLSTRPSVVESTIPSTTPTFMPTISVVESAMPSTTPTFMPTISVSTFPTTSPSYTPTSTSSSVPSNVPSNGPSRSLKPSASPTRSAKPSYYPTSVSSIVPSFFTTFSHSPSTDVIADSFGRENPNARFLLTKEENGRVVVRRCKWLINMPVKLKTRICSGKRFQKAYSKKDNLGPASVTCYDTCSPYCPKEAMSAKFVLETVPNGNGGIDVITKQCQWLAMKTKFRRNEICNTKVSYNGTVFGQANQVCTTQCESCRE